MRQKTGELERAYRSLTQSEKMASLGKLAAVVAHEINNPLAGILTYSKLVSRMADKGFSDEQRLAEAKSYLQIIEGESRRCGGIVKNLLTFARQTPINPQKNDLNAIVERCLLLVGHQMTLQSIELQKKLDPQLPPLYCDAGQVQQALLVILMNAVEAMPHGGRLGIESAYDPAQPPGPRGGERRRAGHSARGSFPHLRTFLHHQGRRQRNRPGPGHRPRHRAATRRKHRGGFHRAERHGVYGPLPEEPPVSIRTAA